MDLSNDDLDFADMTKSRGVGSTGAGSGSIKSSWGGSNIPFSGKTPLARGLVCTYPAETSLWLAFCTPLVVLSLKADALGEPFDKFPREGADSRMTWAFVPPKPKLFTDIRRTPACGQGCNCR